MVPLPTTARGRGKCAIIGCPARASGLGSLARGSKYKGSLARGSKYVDNIYFVSVLYE